MTVEGTLDAMGTASDPVTFTSVNDNSVGGTTGSGSPAVGDWTGIWNNGQVDMTYTSMEYAEIAIGNNSPSTPGSINAENSTFAFDGIGVGGVAEGTVVLTNNTLSSMTGYGFEVNAPSPTIEDNTATDVGTQGTYPAFYVNASALDPSSLGGNSASGGWPLFQLIGTVGSSGTLPAEGAAWSIDGGSLDVPAGVTLTIAKGAVFKNLGGQLTVEGTLVTQGTAHDPIVFTSVNDNSPSVGEDTGTGSPAAGDWGGIVLGVGQASSRFSYTVFEYASAAIQVSLLRITEIPHPRSLKFPTP
jgi:hypothetical protein